MAKITRHSSRAWFPLLTIWAAMAWSTRSAAQSHDWRWSYGLTSNDPEGFNAVAVDHNDGSMCTVGDAENTGIQIGPINLLDQDQGLLIKHDAWGNTIWYAPIGGSDQETAENIAIGPNGTIYVTGAFTGSCYFFNSGSSTVAQTLTSFSGSKDIYLAAYSPNGVIQWARQYGNGNNELYPDVTADDEGVTLLAAYRGSLTSGSFTSAASLSNGNYNLVAIRADLNGTQQWMLTGGSSADDTPGSIASDGSRIYLGYVPGATNFRWYGAGNTLISTTNTTPGDHVYYAISKSATWSWTSIINDPSDAVQGYPNIAADCSGVYIASAVGASSTMADGTVLSNANRHMYVARLNPITGAYNWLRTAAFSSGGSYATPRDIDIGVGGLVHVAGTYKGNPNVLGQSFINASNDDVFLLSLNNDGGYNTHTTINGSNDQYLSSVAADKFGGVAICGSFKDVMNVPGQALTGPSNDNGFIAFAQHGPREPFSEGRANFNVPAAVCAGSTIDLTSWLRPRTVGAVVAVPFSSSVSNPGNVIGAMDNVPAMLAGGPGSMVVDFGSAVPSGESIRIRWRKSATASTAPSLAVAFSTDLTNWTVGATLTASRSSYFFSLITLPIDTRYIRLVAQATNGPIDIDAVCYSYGSISSGTWSGPGITGNVLTPSASLSPTPVTYTVSLANCTTSVTQNVLVLSTPTGGSINGGGTYCPGASGTLTLSGHTAAVLGWESKTDGSSWSAIANTTATHNWSALTETTHFRAVIDGDVCGNVISEIATVVIEDTSPPVASCPVSDTLYVSSASCMATYVIPAILATDNCSGAITANNVHLTSPSGSPVLVDGTALAEDATMSVNAGSTIELPPGIHAFTDTIHDGNGNYTVCNWTITVRDTFPPAITCPANISMNVDAGSCGAVVNYPTPVGSDNCTGATTVRTAGPASGSSFPIGTTTVTHTVTDAAGLTASCSFTVTVVDNLPPQLNSCPLDITIVASPGACTAIANWFEPTATDNCSASLSRVGPASGSSFPIGSTTPITYTATDGSNSSSCVFNVSVIPTAVDLAYGLTEVCQGSGIIMPTIASPSGGVFSDANQSGTINPSTGAFDPSLATPGLHTLDYVFTESCTSHVWFTINVIASPAATISYDGSPYCNSGSSATVTHTGTPGGTYSATAGLAIDPSTGNVDLSASLPGDHLVTYTIPATGACGLFQTTASITVSAAPSATISYAGPFCDNTGQQSPSITGTTGGIFSADPQLALDPSTGIITPGATTSSSTGTSFLVTYSLPAQGGCPAFSTSTNVTITQAPWAGTGGSLELCSNAAPASLIVNGNPSLSGTWSNPSNLPHSGTYDPAVDAPGNYTYTVAGGPGCADHSSMVVVSEIPATSTTTNASACDSYTWSVNGQTYTASGTYTHVTGCMIELLNLTINYPGAICDDGDPYTGNDAFDGNCVCIGQVIDCFNVPGGLAAIDACGVCSGGTTGIMPNSTCLDCHGDVNGTASLDNCGTCVGGNTGEVACVQDCNGDFGGSAFFDNCGNCVGGNTGEVACLADCNGDFGGTAFIDNCGTCVGGNTGEVACVQDCNGDFGGSAELDNCGNCVGGNTGEVACVADCNGDFGGSAFFDNCGNCVGGNTGEVACLADCNGDFGGTAFIDNCGTCVGGNTGAVSCVQDCNGDFGGSAFIDNCGTCVGGNTGAVACVADCNGDFGGTAVIDNCGTCVDGNTGEVACVQDCNGDFGGTAVIDNCGTCVGGNTGAVACVADCNGDFGGTAVIDNCGTCVGGNTGEVACVADCNGDFDGTAVIDNCGTCVGGNTGEVACVADCNGDFGGTAVIDNCGTCVGGNTGELACVADCNGDMGGSATVDLCGVCAGGNTGIVPNSSCLDCAGVPNGTALPGMPCDDNDPCTVNTFFTSSCECVGEFADADGDEICDFYDECPEDPFKSSPGACGCGAPETDSDNDGVPNCIDPCPYLPYLQNGDACGGGAFSGIVINCTCTSTAPLDCEGIPGGTALPGTSCDDGDPNTISDTWNSNCACVGTPVVFDCLGVANGTALPGTSCDDGDLNTIGDTWNSNCACVGTPVVFDCLGVANGTALPGTSCDDGDPNTIGDTWNSNCACVGTPMVFDCLGVANGTALPGTTCNDGDLNTIGDTWNSNCACVGTPVVFDCLGVANGDALPGTTCDDGDTNTIGDTWTSDCACVGTQVVFDCLNVANGTALPGMSCDDGDTNTIDDTWTSDCACVGTPVVFDCLNVANGTALPGTSCDDDDTNTIGDTWTSDCACVGTPVVFDCLNVANGTALPGTSCDDGNTNTISDTWTSDCACVGTPVVFDCLGVANGTALPGSSCDDGDLNTINDTWTSDCACVGTPVIFDCLGVANGNALPGSICDDGDPNTINDTWTSDCACTGMPVVCESDAGTDLTTCGMSTTLSAVAQGQWSATAGISFSSISDPHAFVTAVEAGVYELIWTVQIGSCSDRDTILVTFQETHDAAFAYAQSTYCTGSADPSPWMAEQGGHFSADPTGLIIDTMTGSIAVDESEPGTYTITYVFSGSCPAMSTQQVSIAEAPDASWIPPASICAGGAIIDLGSISTQTPGGTWNGPNVTGATLNPSGLSGSVALTYTVVSGACESSVVHLIDVNASPMAQAGADTVICGLSTVLSALPTDFTGTWSNLQGSLFLSSSTDPMASVNAPTYGTYHLLWTATNGACTFADTLTLTFVNPRAPIQLDAGPDQFLLGAEATQLEATATAGAQLQWTLLEGVGSISAPNDGSTMVNGLEPGDNVFLVTAVLNACVFASDSIRVHVDELFIPEGFSPNGDGVNDRWEITGIEYFPAASLKVFNRWGQLVYESDAYRNEWDGRAEHGRDLPDGTYFYVLNLRREITYNGDVILKR